MSEQPIDLITAAILLFLIMDPIGNVPVFLSLLKHVPRERWRPVLLRELCFALLVLVGFLFVGRYLMDLLQLKRESISIGGGIILFIIALRMIFPPDTSQQHEQRTEEPFLVPLAVPLIAGPSTIATLLVLAQSAPERLLRWLAALLLAWVGTALILLSSRAFYRLLGERGLMALERLMGMLLVAMAVQMFLNGLHDFLTGHMG